MERLQCEKTSEKEDEEREEVREAVRVKRERLRREKINRVADRQKRARG